MKNHKLSRRSVLRFGAMSAAGAAITTSFARAAFAAPQAGGKLLCINLRGGWDGLHVIIPNGRDSMGMAYDPDYYASRDDLELDFTAASTIETGNTFCSMHPALDATTLGNLGVRPMITGGRIAFIHQTGLWSRTGSHFEDQRTVETGIQPTLSTTTDREEGWATRALSSGFDGVSLSENLQQLFQTGDAAKVLPHVRTLLGGTNGDPTYSLDTSKPTLDDVYRGVPLLSPGNPFGYGLAGHYGSNGAPTHVLEAYNRAVGSNMILSEDTIRGITKDPMGQTIVYAPSNGARYPIDPDINVTTGAYPNPMAVGLKNFSYVRNFMRNLRDAVWLLKHTSVRVVGIELGGWDTHGSQGKLTGNMPDRLAALAYGLRAVDLDIGAGMPGAHDITTLCFSEFGRTSAENGGDGTDHGAGTVFIAAGDRVNLNGGSVVYGCDQGSWPGVLSATDGNVNPSIPLTNGTFVRPTQNILGLFAQAMTSVLGTPTGDLTRIMPGYDAALHTSPTYV